MQNLVSSYASSEDYRDNMRISVAVRWFLLASWFLQFNYRPDFANPTYIPNTLAALSLVILNAYIHWRVRSGLPVTWPWALGLSTLDVTAISLGMVFSGGFANNFFILYYPALAIFAIVFTSTPLSFAGATVVALVYIVISLFVGEGVSWAIKEEKVLLIRVATMYGIVVAVNLIGRLQRRREAERTLQKERIRVSEEIHDGAAQSAFIISLGLEACHDLARENCPELSDRIKALHSQAKQAIWELRYPINLGAIFEGRELGPMLASHIENFGTVTSISSTFGVKGAERGLPISLEQKLFAVAHNALTNTYKHANARSVGVELAYSEQALTLSVRDDGVGLDSEQIRSASSHGIRNMRRVAEELGGSLDVSGASGEGTVVTLTVPHQERVDGEPDHNDRG